MVALSAVGFGVFFLASLAIGVRLVALAARTGRQPELLIGIGILGIGPTAMGSMMAAAALAGSAPSLARGLTGLAFVAIIFGFLVGPQFFRGNNLELIARQTAIVCTP